ncbi:MAG: flavodoxin domain-containing protein [Muribaculaceae bacterium]|nr:flavodoxin domain-containing protein [Muribaculaceae bacterium]
MKKIGVFYGSETGTTADVARRIARKLEVGDEDVFDVADTAPSNAGDYDLLVLGTSTWGDGEPAESWLDFISGLEVMDLHGKEAALFGCGDETMTDTFCSGVGVIYNRLKPTKIRFIAPYDTIGYSFDESMAKPGGALEAVGLLLDEVNHPELTETRLAGWTSLIKREIK